MSIRPEMFEFLLVSHGVLFAPSISLEEIRGGVAQAIEAGWGSVYVEPLWMRDAERLLRNSSTASGALVSGVSGAVVRPTLIRGLVARCISMGATGIEAVLPISLMLHAPGRARHLAAGMRAGVNGKMTLSLHCDLFAIPKAEWERIALLLAHTQADRLVLPWHWGVTDTQIADLVSWLSAYRETAGHDLNDMTYKVMLTCKRDAEAIAVLHKKCSQIRSFGFTPETIPSGIEEIV